MRKLKKVAWKIATKWQKNILTPNCRLCGNASSLSVGTKKKPPFACEKNKSCLLYYHDCPFFVFAFRAGSFHLAPVMSLFPSMPLQGHSFIQLRGMEGSSSLGSLRPSSKEKYMKLRYKGQLTGVYKHVVQVWSLWEEHPPHSKSSQLPK